MKQHAAFIDRVDAGKKLAQKFTYLDPQKTVVCAIPNGGIPVGVQIAQALGCPLTPLLVHKLHLPNHPEVGFGALTSDGTVEINHQAAKKLELTQPEIEEIIQETAAKLQKRREKYNQDQTPINLMLKTAIIVDDGIASGYTALAAIRAVKKKNPKKTIFAIPTTSAWGFNFIKDEVDEVIDLYLHPEHFPYQIKDSYENWHRLTEDEVEEILDQFYQGRRAQSNLP